ncbi:MAG TPA: UDP-glucose/GDP-mannose dehydrogenase family protein [Candidatus Nanoarchaeia archaeon]|nr:UDP-glucose/GDP-mannose dehydrogenase family protein [Candidatus Nanoarchaeia archaeon]
MKIAIIGTGYVGLCTGACFADLGNDVVCMDIAEEKIEKLRKGIIPIYEPQLKELVDRNAAIGKLKFTASLKEAVGNSEVIFIAVGTPPRHDGSADLSYVENVAYQIAKVMDGYHLIVEKSTVPVQTGKRVERTIKENARHGIEFDVASNPEFLREGSAIHDFLHPDRIVIGVSSERAAILLKKLYEPLNAPIIVTDINSAEIIKHASNSFLATKISFINAVANICEKTGANIEEVAHGIGLDKRIGKSFLNAGIGYGGSCFPKDVSAFVKISEDLGYDFKLLREVETINKRQKELFLKKIHDGLWNLSGKTVGVLGLAFKPDTDDMREAPSIDIINYLVKEGARVKAYDPAAMENAKKILPIIDYCVDEYEVARNVDALIIVTEWKEFKEIDMNCLKSAMKKPLIFDGRNMFDKQKMKALGFQYISVGR